MAGRKMVLGDIHGELEMLKEVLARSAFDFENDLLIQLGDICDRGKSSYEAAELLKQCKKLILVEGNHDQWFKSYLRSNLHDADEQWLKQGGMTTIESYSAKEINPLIHESFYARQVPYYIDEEKNCYVHGGFNRHYLIAAQDKELFAWDRHLVNEMMNCKPGEKLKTADDFRHIYIGHTPTVYWSQFKPVTRGGITNMDTGAGKGERLTIMDVATSEFWQSH